MLNTNTALQVETSQSLNRIRMCLVDTKPITEDMAKGVQNPDYPIMGYGFWGFKCVEQPDGTYLATWFCNASCD